MSRPTAVIVLCEDNRTFSFTRTYLKRCGIEDRGIRPITSPRGRGCGFDFVIKNFAAQVNAYKLVSARLHTWLVAIVDADTGTVAQRIGQMNAELTNAGSTAEHRNVDSGVEFQNRQRNRRLQEHN
jgi:hypothetical protein